MTRSSADGGEVPTDADIQTLLDHERRVDAARRRRREQWLRRQAAEEGTLVGALMDLGERGVHLSVSTAGARTVRGTLELLGQDFIGLHGDGGSTTLVPLAVVATVRPEDDGPATIGDRWVGSGVSLDATTAELAADRPPVSLHTVSGELVAGRLWSAGRDLLTVRSDDAKATYVALACLNDLTVG